MSKKTKSYSMSNPAFLPTNDGIRDLFKRMSKQKAENLQD